MLLVIREAMNSSTSGGTGLWSRSALLRRMARRVSRSGGWMSVMRPHLKRPRRRSSSVGMASGMRSELMTICLFAPCRELNVWKNSSWRPSLPSMNWMSSISSTSMSRYRRLKFAVVLVRMASTYSLRKVSVLT